MTGAVVRRGPQFRERCADLPPTPRQLEVARYLSHGLTSGMVAEAMFLSPATVRDHRRDLRYRLGAKTTSQALCECLRRGYID